jgi:peptidoglycan LD-endopeptidase LytH
MKLTGKTLVLMSLVLSACAHGERLNQPSRSAVTAPRDVYAGATHAHLEPAAVRAWEAASRRALRSGLMISPSFREHVRFPVGEAHAVAYRFTLREGQVLRIRHMSLDGGGALFTDIFEHLGGEVFRPAGSAGRGASELTFAAQTTGDYVLRLQPEVGGSGLYEIAVDGDAPLVFPVADASVTRIGSVFGDPRDGGARPHEGIDIMAPRGTPVVAVTDGTITQVATNPIGGRVIWLSDSSSGLSYYYAHLDEHLIHPGAFVQAGDTIGTVGNTGNASRAAPHLHFGIYRPGRIALDPGPLLAGAAVAAVHVEVDQELLGRWVRTSGDRVRLRNSPTLAGAILAELGAATPLFVLGGVADWHRVLLPDGTSGFVASQFTTADDNSWP